MPIVETVNQQLFLVASLMARPELINALFPPTARGSGSDLDLLDNATARAAATILASQGPAFATPSAMLAALTDLPVEIDGPEAVALIQLMPSAEDVKLEALTELKNIITQTTRDRRLASAVQNAGQQFNGAGTADVLDNLERSIREYRQGSVAKDHSTVGILDRMRHGQVTTRWQIGCPYLDKQVQGIGPDGKYGYGVAAQGEVTMITAKYGVGKTRWLFNIMVALLDQGAVLDLIVGEDNEATYSVKLMGVKYNLPKWMVERYIIDQKVFIDEYGFEVATKCEQATDWYASLGQQLYLFDGGSKVNIFKFPSAKGLLEERVKLDGAHFALVDYVQMWKGDTQTLEGYAQDMREFAGRNNVGLILLSQIPNDAMKFGVTPGMLPSKGTGEWGQIAHFGYFLTSDPIIGQKELKIEQVKGRDAGGDQVWAHFNVETGKIEDYAGAPTFMPSPELPKEAGTKKGPGKRGGN